MKTTAIIVAAGQGLRFGNELPKQFQILKDKPVICHTIACFEMASSIDEIVIITAKDWMPFVAQEIVERFVFTKVTRIIEGGKERQDSVYKGLKGLDGVDFVAIHDAVRPLVSDEMINRAVSACHQFAAVVPAVPLKDTIKQVENGFIAATVNRDKLWSAQTPQVFKYDLLINAYERAYENNVLMTDDSALVERLGVPVQIIDGSYQNIKITVPADLKIAEVLLEDF